MKIFLILLFFGFFAFPATNYAASPSISTTETVANVTAGTDDQDASTVITQANVEEVKATRTLTVGVLPGNNETITIGTCVVTYASSTGATNDEIDCADDVATIDRDTGAEDTPRTAGEIAGAMRTLTNVSDTGHGALTVSGSGSDVTFTTTNTESSETDISFSDATGGDITSTASTTGVVPVAQVNTITITGTVDTEDVFTATLPAAGGVDYTVTSSDVTTSDIATGLDTAIQASTGYATQDFTSAASTNTVVLTAKVAGTGFTQTSSATNRAAVAQVVVFTPTNTQNNYSYTITIDGTDYTYNANSGDTLKGIVEGLQTLVNAHSAVSCTEDDTAITCTATSAGTTFTYDTSTNTSKDSSSSGSGIHFGCKDKNASNYEYFARHRQSLCEYPTQADKQQSFTELINKHREVLLKAQSEGLVLPPLVLELLNQRSENQQSNMTATIAVRDLKTGMTGDDVRMLQQLLNSQGYTLADSEEGSPGNETTYFGTLTQKALAKYQSANGIAPAAGYFGPITRTQMKNTRLSDIWW